MRAVGSRGQWRPRMRRSGPLPVLAEPPQQQAALLREVWAGNSSPATAFSHRKETSPGQRVFAGWHFWGAVEWTALYPRVPSGQDSGAKPGKQHRPCYPCWPQDFEVSLRLGVGRSTL